MYGDLFRRRFNSHRQNNVPKGNSLGSDMLILKRKKKGTKQEAL
jgi:hypothetical protein